MKDDKKIKYLKKISFKNKNLEGKNLDFNFFAPYRGKSHITIEDNSKLYISIAGIVTGAIIILTLGINLFQISITKRDISKLEEQLNNPENQKKIAQVEKLNKKQDILNKYYDEASKITKVIDNSAFISTAFMDKLTSVIPESISFKTSNIVNGVVDINGTSSSRNQIAELQHNLKALDMVKDVQVSSINEGTGSSNKNDYSFSLKCILKGVENNEGK